MNATSAARHPTHVNKPRLQPPGRYVLRREQIVAAPLEKVFEFFSDAVNLERLTPAFLRFAITTAMPIRMQAGTELEYTLRLLGKRIDWKTLIRDFDPPHSFVDVQVRGPYSLWHHRHTFESCNQGTRMVDHIDYDVPLGPLGSMAHVVMVRPMLERIFDYRARIVSQLFPSETARRSELVARAPG
ncbi:MAG: SRPBCC family protein [Deltaproteobacteria bacterium]|nr:SRPBCC family protein [Deltaproteobacteria bacterium]